MNKRRPARKPSAPRRAAPPGRNAPRPSRQKVDEEAGSFRIVERPTPDTRHPTPGFSGPFRVLIAVHRPRFRGRSERAAALVDWQVTALLNKQDPVGQCAKPPRPPDLLVLSGDFGRQKDYAIFRAVQPYRAKGMKLIGLVEDCETAPEGFPDSAPAKLCDLCLTPPFKTADLREVFTRFYEEMRGEPAPPPISGRQEDTEEEE